MALYPEMSSRHSKSLASALSPLDPLGKGFLTGKSTLIQSLLRLPQENPAKPSGSGET